MNPRNRVFAVMAASFVLLGMPMAAMGVAWPSAAEDLGRTLADLGLITFAYGAGYTVSTLASGELTRRFSTGPLLVAAASAAAASLAVFAISSTWIPFLVAGFMVGLAGGLLDAGVNAYVAVHRGARAMGIIHTGFGIGSTIGPLLVALIISLGWSWRIAFGAFAVAELMLAIAFVATVSAIDSNELEGGARPSVGNNGLVLALSLTVFFLYAGVAAGTGAWSYSLLTEGRGFSTAVAGVAVAAYWGGVTAGRAALGVFGNRVEPNRVLTMSAVGTVASLLLLWIAPTPWLGIVGLIASGLSHGFVFPLEVLLTPRRFGAGFAPWAVGYEIAAANVGVAVVSGTIGLLVGRWGIFIVAPALVVVALALWAAIETLRVQSALRSAAPA
ncbi:MAG: MFS transporter [Acidimicrobiia bacterium]